MDPRTKLAMAIASVKTTGSAGTSADLPSDTAITTLDLPEPPIVLSMDEEQRRVQQREGRDIGEGTEREEPTVLGDLPVRSRRTGRKPVPSPEERSTALNSILNYMDSVFQTDFLHRYQGDNERDSEKQQ